MNTPYAACHCVVAHSLSHLRQSIALAEEHFSGIAIHACYFKQCASAFFCEKEAQYANVGCEDLGAYCIN
jgi:hypothetical protein